MDRVVSHCLQSCSIFTAAPPPQTQCKWTIHIIIKNFIYSMQRQKSPNLCHCHLPTLNQIVKPWNHKLHAKTNCLLLVVRTKLEVLGTLLVGNGLQYIEDHGQEVISIGVVFNIIVHCFWFDDFKEGVLVHYVYMERMHIRNHFTSKHVKGKFALVCIVDSRRTFLFIFFKFWRK